MQQQLASQYLVDTNVLVAFSKQRELGYSTMLSLLRSGGEIGICHVIVTKFFAGIHPDDRERWAVFIDALGYWQVDGHIAITTPDALVAAVVVEINAVVVTLNVRHYPIAGLKVLVP